MAVTARTPVIIGVGDVTNLSTRVEDAKEPMQLMLEAIRAAVENTGLPTERQNELRKGIDSIDVVATWSWPYCDLPGQIGDRLGVERLKHKRLSDHGGNSPGLMLHQAAARIADGHCDLSVVTGGEALASGPPISLFYSYITHTS
jgi:acetyl-CoA acetyltransferase